MYWSSFFIQNASCDPEGEKATWRTECSNLKDLLGQGGVIFFAARHSSLLAEYTLFQVVRSAMYGRIKSAIKCGDMLGMNKDGACWVRDEDEDTDRRGPSSCGATACRLLAALDNDSLRVERLLIGRTL
jgi:hypothetical protein